MQDCVLVWVMSAFLQDCNDGDLRWRSRTVLRWPEGDHTCPDLNQTQPCVNMTCLKYSYVYSGTVTNVHTSQFTDCQKSVLSTLWSAGSEFVCVCVLKTGVAVNSVKMQYAAGGLRLDSWTVSAAMESLWNWACAKRWLFFSYWNSFTIKALIGIWRFYCFLLFSSWVLHVESSLPPVRWAALLIAWLQSGPPGQNVHTPVEAKVRSTTDM